MDSSPLFLSIRNISHNPQISSKGLVNRCSMLTKMQIKAKKSKYCIDTGSILLAKYHIYYFTQLF